MKSTVCAVLLALLVFALSIPNAEAGGQKGRKPIPTVLTPGLPASAPVPTVVMPPPRVVLPASPPQVARKKEPTCVWRSEALPTTWEPARIIQVQGMAVPLCDQRQLWLHGSIDQQQPRGIQGTALMLDCSTTN